MDTPDLSCDSLITERIHVLRGGRVILDADLAALYGVTTSRLNEQVKRNASRFPADFTFELSNQEVASLRSQIAISSGGYGGRRHAIRSFTEHGAVMAASVLNTPRAVEVSVYVVRAFVRLRGVLSAHVELSRRLDDLERAVGDQGDAIRQILGAIRHLTAEPAAPTQRPIGFRPDPDARGEAIDPPPPRLHNPV